MNAPFSTAFDNTPQRSYETKPMRNPMHFSNQSKQQDDSLISFMKQNQYKQQGMNNRPSQSMDNSNNQKFVNNYEQFFRGSTPDDLEAQVRQVQMQRKNIIGKQSPNQQNIFKPQPQSSQPYINAQPKGQQNYTRNQNLFWTADSKSSTRNGNFGSFNNSSQTQQIKAFSPQQPKVNSDFSTNATKFFDDNHTNIQEQPQNYRPQVRAIQQNQKISQSINSQPKQKNSTFEKNIQQFFGEDEPASNNRFPQQQYQQNLRSPQQPRQQQPQARKDPFTSNVDNFFAVEETHQSPQRQYNQYNILSRMPQKYQIDEGHKIGVTPAQQSKFEMEQGKNRRGFKEMSGFKAQSFNPNMHQNICNFFGEQAPPGYQSNTKKNQMVQDNSPFKSSNNYNSQIEQMQEQRIRNERNIAQSRLAQMNQISRSNFFEFESEASIKKQDRCYKSVKGLDVEAGDVFNPMTGKWMKVQRSGVR